MADLTDASAGIQVRRAEPDDASEVAAILERHGMHRAARRGEMVDIVGLPALLAERDGMTVGVLSYLVEGADLEVLALYADTRRDGTGTALLDALGPISVEHGCRRMWLVTTNDNLDALRFYQRRGFVLRSVNAGAVDRARERLKPSIPTVGEYGIPIRDEVELERWLPVLSPTSGTTGKPGAEKHSLELRDHEARNRASWNSYSDEYQARHGEQLATSTGLAWGTWQIPEAELQVLGDVAGRDILEFGCGAAQWSIALARLGARPVGLDLSERQLEHARRLMTEAGVDFPLVHASAEAVSLPDASFDIVFCDHGAMTFADPFRTVPEAARLLRPGGLFAFSHGSTIETLCWEVGAERPGDRLAYDYFGMHVMEDDGELVFNLGYGEWIRVFRSNGFVVEDLIEPRPAEDATSSYRDADARAWSRRWPGESIWRLRKA